MRSANPQRELVPSAGNAQRPLTWRQIDRAAEGQHERLQARPLFRPSDYASARCACAIEEHQAARWGFV